MNENFYGESIINQIRGSNDFSDTARWQVFKPDLDLPKPYIQNGILITPEQDWSKEKVDQYFSEKKASLIQRHLDNQNVHTSLGRRTFILH